MMMYHVRQDVQKRLICRRHRGLSFRESDCALNLMRKPLEPFSDQTTNLFHLTSQYSRPVDVFDYSSHFDYHYDTLKLNGWTIPQLEEVLKQQRSVLEVVCVCVCVCVCVLSLIHISEPTRPP